MNDPELYWLEDATEETYQKAKTFLSLLFHKATTKHYIEKLKESKVVKYNVNDIFRAAGVSPLEAKCFESGKELNEIIHGGKLSPILLVRDTMNSRMIIASDFDILSQIFHFSNKQLINVKII